MSEPFGRVKKRMSPAVCSVPPHGAPTQRKPSGAVYEVTESVDGTKLTVTS